ncbi:hypothetical protein TRFO_39691 [Tritrichomonas foetus]|uniref:Uncharacterized protein n=1 Tax=Tritrichomonas foetus TaxID=1144522 RepID=A0A1J4J3W4_9EUKA|nr:hypothetical protein TRFO_39691 [Tritrichomonas foetus]|eukprot:OHS94136.1 hypothetical protein TRFO_39691 [Tritrichomonas foetus]
MLKRLSFESIPWDENDSPVVPLNLTKDTEITSLNPFQETENWMPFYQSSIPFFQMQVIDNITQRYEVVVTSMQRYFTECGFKWFYPHDLLILARQMNDYTDLLIRVEYLDDEKLRLYICLASGDDLGFSALVAGISKVLL